MDYNNIEENNHLCDNSCDHEHEHEHEHNHDHGCDHDHQHEDNQQYQDLPESPQSLRLIEFVMQTNDFKYTIALASAFLILSFQAMMHGINQKNTTLAEECFDCLLNGIVVLFATYCGIRAKNYNATNTFPFGMVRMEVLSAFTICLHTILMCLLSFSRNVHEIFDEFQGSNSSDSVQMYYVAGRIIIGFVGLFALAEYLQSKMTMDGDQLYSQFIDTYRPLVGRRAEHLYSTHYTNMNAIVLICFTELLLNLGVFLEYMLEDIIQFNAIGVLINISSLFIVYLLLKPILIQTAYTLLLATSEQYQSTKSSILQIPSVQNCELLIWGTVPQNVIINIYCQPNRGIREEVTEIVKHKFNDYFINMISV